MHKNLFLTKIFINATLSAYEAPKSHVSRCLFLDQLQNVSSMSIITLYLIIGFESGFSRRQCWFYVWFHLTITCCHDHLEPFPFLQLKNELKTNKYREWNMENYYDFFRFDWNWFYLHTFLALASRELRRKSTFIQYARRDTLMCARILIFAFFFISKSCVRQMCKKNWVRWKFCAGKFSSWNHAWFYYSVYSLISMITWRWRIIFKAWLYSN